ncbi:right-handed parallel beta-helix repeat-containing protein, partial [Aeromicrobium duanguangcaii]|uniref:right-handed parallel beta-helix repeat-containing protein n=1 Tax=Aeromicrobium duanguangcaii TaxID=2968086 RepID=UPI001E4FE215
MRPPRTTGCLFSVSILVACLLAFAAPSAQAAPARGQIASGVTPAAAVKQAQAPKLRLAVSRSKVSPGSRVPFRVTNGTNVKRPVRIQRWDPRKRVWRTVATRTVKRTTRVTLRVPKGTWRYRAVAPTTKIRPATKVTRIRAVRSRVVSVRGIVTRKPAQPAPRPTEAPAPGPEPSAVPGPEPSAAPGPEPTAVPSPTPSPSVPVPSGGSSDAGSVALGEASYPVPAGAVFVSPSGSDAGKGTQAAPLRTITRATSVTPAGGTIVLRGGEYRESVMMPGHKALHIQNYPGEAAWLDGSQVVTGWAKSGSTWVRSGWTAEFDRSPTYTRGKADGTEPGWQFVNPAYPMAAHPDQVFVDGKPLQQVKSRDLVKAGTFYADYARDELVIGSDPAGRTVRASDLVLGLTATAPGSTVRGIGVFRYANSVPDKGVLRLYAANQTVENVIVSDSATQGIALLGSNITLRKVTSSDNGLNGIETSKTNNLMIDRVRVERNNRERFNPAPVAAGIKAHTTRGGVIKDSVFSNNHANGIWFDVSNHDIKIWNNDVSGNSDDGVILELSQKLQVINNRIVGNGVQGLFLLDSGDAQIWNNTIIGGTDPVRIHDTPRNAKDLNSAPYGYDPRQPKPDPTVTWEVFNIEMKNNVIGGQKGGWCGVFCLLNDSDSRTGAQMAKVDGNIYQRTSATAPKELIRWSGGKGVRTNYGSLTAFRTAVGGQETSGTE